VGIFQTGFIFWNGVEIETVINPKLLSQYWQESFDKEGCLSVPNKFVTIGRPKKIMVEFETIIDGKIETVKKELRDLSCRIFLHEMDHLSGILITDYK
ncbi:MAG: peptide deformylase, partial [Candidatus Paceibacterota bacterium]